MSSKNPIIHRINQDLRMQPLDDESEISYVTRLVYSASALKIRSALLNIEFIDGCIVDKGRSQKHMAQYVLEFLDCMLSQYPEMSKWFMGKDEKMFSSIIINRLKAFGDIQAIGSNSQLMLPEEEVIQIKNGLYLKRGLCDEKKVVMSGLAPLLIGKPEEKAIISDIKALLENVNRADEVLNDYIKNIQWQRVELDNLNYKIFDPLHKSFFSHAWNESSEIPRNKISIYKNDYGQFGFIKFCKNNCYISEISSYLIETYEVNRFLLGLKAECCKQAKAYYHYNKVYVILKLECNLPLLELSIFNLFGWPVRHIQDSYNFIFHESIWEWIYDVLENLCIELVGE
ncbi:hypothetical protein AN1V17_40060 [Vallitalea sediminicola]